MVLPVFLLFFAKFASGQYVLLPDNMKALVENPAETVETCTLFDITPDANLGADAKLLIEKACVPVVKSRQHRAKRYIYPIVNYKPTLSEMFMPSKSKRNLKKLSEKTEEMEKKLSELTSFIGKSNLTVPFEKIQSLLQWNGTEFTSYFGYPIDFVADAWEAMLNKSLECDASNRLELHVCGRRNTNREWGDHKTAVSIGQFTSHGTIYKARDIPEHVVSVRGKDMSASSCVLLSTYYECQASRNMSCTISDYKKCNETVHLTPQKVFLRDVGAGTTVVAADVKEYTTFIDEEYATHPMDLSKHAVITLPVGSYAKFNDFKVFGKAIKNFDHFSLHHDADTLPLKHGDLDILEEKEGKHPEIEKHREPDMVTDLLELFFKVLFWTAILVLVTILLAIFAFNRYIDYIDKMERRRIHPEPAITFLENTRGIFN